MQRVSTGNLILFSVSAALAIGATACSSSPSQPGLVGQTPNPARTPVAYPAPQTEECGLGLGKHTLSLVLGDGTKLDVVGSGNMPWNWYVVPESVAIDRIDNDEAVSNFEVDLAPALGGWHRLKGTVQWPALTLPGEISREIAATLKSRFPDGCSSQLNNLRQQITVAPLAIECLDSERYQLGFVAHPKATVPEWYGKGSALPGILVWPERKGAAAGGSANAQDCGNGFRVSGNSAVIDLKVATDLMDPYLEPDFSRFLRGQETQYLDFEWRSGSRIALANESALGEALTMKVEVHWAHPRYVGDGSELGHEIQNRTAQPNTQHLRELYLAHHGCERIPHGIAQGFCSGI